LAQALSDDLYSSSDAPDLLTSNLYAAQLNSDTLTIAVPWSDGTVHSYRCVAAPIDQYNGDVTEMQDGIEAAQNAAASAAAASAEASSSASSSASAAAAAQEQAIAQKEDATCAQAGGTWIGPYACQVKYTDSEGQTYDYEVGFDATGNVLPESCSDDAFSASNDCLNTQETTQQAETDCANGSYNGGQPGEWHSDTDICSF
jgi:hypothetical protein